jgi:hypothetical protein
MSLKDAGLAAGTLVLGATLALLDLKLFFVIPALAFIIHNLLAIGVGGTIAGISWRILGRAKSHRHILLINIFVGIAMIIIHAVKLIWGKCS